MIVLPVARLAVGEAEGGAHADDLLSLRLDKVVEILLHLWINDGCVRGFAGLVEDLAHEGTELHLHGLQLVDLAALCVAAEGLLVADHALELHVLALLEEGLADLEDVRHRLLVHVDDLLLVVQQLRVNVRRLLVLGRRVHRHRRGKLPQWHCLRRKLGTGRERGHLPSPGDPLVWLVLRLLRHADSFWLHQRL